MAILPRLKIAPEAAAGGGGRGAAGAGQRRGRRATSSSAQTVAELTQDKLADRGQGAGPRAFQLLRRRTKDACWSRPRRRLPPLPSTTSRHRLAADAGRSRPRRCRRPLSPTIRNPARQKQLMDESSSSAAATPSPTRNTIRASAASSKPAAMATSTSSMPGGNLLYSVAKNPDFAENFRRRRQHGRTSPLGQAFQAAAKLTKPGGFSFVDAAPYAPIGAPRRAFVAAPVFDARCRQDLAGVVAFEMPQANINVLLELLDRARAAPARRSSSVPTTSSATIRCSRRSTTCWRPSYDSPAVDAALGGECGCARRARAISSAPMC